MAQCDDRQHADDADDNDGGFENAGGDVTECHAFVLPLKYGEERYSGADARNREGYLKERAGIDAGIGTPAKDIVRVVEHRPALGQAAFTAARERGRQLTVQQALG